MKNLLLSLLIVAISFLGTTFVLNSMLSKNIEGPDSAVVTTADNYDDESDDTDETSENSESSAETFVSSSDLDFLEILSDHDSWKDYQNENIELSTDFIAIDDEGIEVDKKDFLERLLTGKYIPLKRPEAEYMYQLYRFDSDTDEKIGKSIKSISSVAYSYFLKEGTPFPAFDFKDINGNEFSTNNTSGKLLVIECWYIQCTKCIQEFPKLNDLYDRYEAHDDVVFLSLSFDKSAKLKKFLAKKEFRYPVVADKKEFLQNKIQAKQYPTHLIIDEYGNILKMVNNVDSLILALDTIVNGNLLDDETM